MGMVRKFKDGSLDGKKIKYKPEQIVSSKDRFNKIHLINLGKLSFLILLTETSGPIGPLGMYMST